MNANSFTYLQTTHLSGLKLFLELFSKELNKKNLRDLSFWGPQAKYFSAVATSLKKCGRQVEEKAKMSGFLKFRALKLNFKKILKRKGKRSIFRERAEKEKKLFFLKQTNGHLQPDF